MMLKFEFVMKGFRAQVAVKRFLLAALPYLMTSKGIPPSVRSPARRTDKFPRWISHRANFVDCNCGLHHRCMFVTPPNISDPELMT